MNVGGLSQLLHITFQLSSQVTEKQFQEVILKCITPVTNVLFLGQSCIFEGA